VKGGEVAEGEEGANIVYLFADEMGFGRLIALIEKVWKTQVVLRESSNVSFLVVAYHRWWPHSSAAEQGSLGALVAI
jgi:hypothetical protein